MIFASEASLIPLLSKSGFPFAARADSSHYPIERLDECCGSDAGTNTFCTDQLVMTQSVERDGPED